MPKDTVFNVPALDKKFGGVAPKDPDAEHLARLADRPFPSIDPKQKCSSPIPARFMKS